MENYHNLGSNGFGHKDTINKDQIQVCKNWIKRWITPRKTINLEKGSYGLKHVVEKNSNQYISNGAFIKAALDLGYSYKVKEPNAFFGMAFVKAKKNKESSYKLT